MTGQQLCSVAKQGRSTRISWIFADREEEFLCAIDLFKHMTKYELGKLSDLLESECFDAGDDIMKQGGCLLDGAGVVLARQQIAPAASASWC